MSRKDAADLRRVADYLDIAVADARKAGDHDTANVTQALSARLNHTAAEDDRERQRRGGAR